MAAPAMFPTDHDEPVERLDRSWPLPFTRYGLRMISRSFCLEAWTELTERLSTAGVRFVIPPHRRYEGRINEQARMLLRDPSGNAIEFKAFADPEHLFAT